MDGAVALVQRRAAPQLLADVVEPGHGEERVFRDDLFAQRVEFFGEVANGDLLGFGGFRERKVEKHSAW
jgi:hypothetical protein